MSQLWAFLAKASLNEDHDIRVAVLAGIGNDAYAPVYLQMAGLDCGGRGM